MGSKVLQWVKSEWFRLTIIVLWVISIYEASRIADHLLGLGGIAGNLFRGISVTVR